ncbi:hypothetical protein QUF90_16250 [Desulfococcaceae bacterium HSG9]|nr:hypothetical protein [Desulfococcaceae bacterium HSG9]
MMIEKHIRLRAEVWGSDMDRYVLKHPVEEIDDIIVDAEAFFKTRSTCESCGICCKWGAAIPEETTQKLAGVLDEIRQGYIPRERWNSVGWFYSKKNSANWLNSKEYKEAYTNIVEMEDGNKECCFLYKKEKKNLCAIHSWALEKQVPIFEYCLFECIMYPIAVMPYRGLLYPGRTFLTLYSSKNMELVDIYGGRPDNSVYNIWKEEIKKRIRKKLWFIPKPEKQDIAVPWVSLEKHFHERKNCIKPLSYVNYERIITWYFGKVFYEMLCKKAEKHLSNSVAREVDICGT